MNELRIDAREAQRLRERFLTRAQAVFYARLSFLLLSAAVLFWQGWRETFPLSVSVGIGLYVLALGNALIAHILAAHRLHGRWVMFSSLIIDLMVLLVIIANSGGLLSPAMAAQLLFTIFFALLFPNPIAVVPPLLLLPVVVWSSQFSPERPIFSVELIYLCWYATLNGIAVYVTVYLTGQEEKQNREILELENELKKLAVVEERNRLARDIHDGMGASLSGLVIQSEFLMTLAKGQPQVLEEIVELKSAAEEAMDEVRRALVMMRDEFDLKEQLEKAVSTFQHRHRIPIEIKMSGEPPPMPEEMQLAMFRILQECLTNIAKHAQAQKVQVEVLFGPAQFAISIADDGTGFDVENTPKNHYGLLNMRERARKVGGTMTFASQIGQGTTVTLTIERPQDVKVAPNALTASAAIPSG